MSYRFEVIPMDEDDRQSANDEQAWMEFQKAKNDINNQLCALSGDCMQTTKLVEDDHLEDAVASLRDYLLKEVKKVIQSIERLTDERP